MPAILAVEIGTVFTAVFLIVMFLGWVMQAVQGQNQQKGPVRRGQGGNRGNGPRGPRGAAGQGGRPQPRPRDDRLRTEIDAFLEEVDAPREDRDRDRDRGREREREPVIEIVEPPRPRPSRPRPEPQRPARPVGDRPSRERSQKPAQRPRREQRPSPEQPTRPAQRPRTLVPEARQTPAPSPPEQLGTGLRSHVTTYMDDHIDEDVAAHLPHLRSSVGARGGADSSASSVSRPAAHAIVARLRSPEGMQQAIILGEILARPRCLRRE